MSEIRNILEKKIVKPFKKFHIFYKHLYYYFTAAQALTLSNDSRKEKTAGQLVSLISEDLDKVTYAMEEIYYVILTPIQVSKFD